MSKQVKEKYHKSLHQQAQERIKNMIAYGESKHEAVEKGGKEAIRYKVYARDSYRTYYNQIKYFLRYVVTNYKDCRKLDDARVYVREYLEERIKEGKSKWTIHTEAKALGKLFGITPDDKDYFKPPSRQRVDITRSRIDVQNDRNFSEANHFELVTFCKSCGARRREVKTIKGGDLFTKEELLKEIEKESSIPVTKENFGHKQALKDIEVYTKDEKYYVHILRGKGGKERYSPIIGKYVNDIVERFENTPDDKKLWDNVPKNADIHSYRAVYATALYKIYARNTEDINKDKVIKGTKSKFSSEIYYCRNDEKGKKLDKAAMQVVSKALGHNRLSIVASNYLRGL